MTDRELLEKIAAQVGVLTNNMDGLTNHVENGFKDVNSRVHGLQYEIKDVRDEMEEGFKDVNNKFDGLQAEMQEGFREAYNERQEMKSSINKVEMKIEKIEMTIENDVNKNINLLVEGQKDINNKIDKVLKFQDEKELLTIRIEILENELSRLKTRLDEIA